MSLNAMAWVVEDAPGITPHLMSTLMAIANEVDSRGQGCRVGQVTLAFNARKKVRALRNDLRELETAGLIRRGDQRLVQMLPADKRPVVWDLAIERKMTTAERQETIAALTGAARGKGSVEQERQAAECLPPAAVECRSPEPSQDVAVGTTLPAASGSGVPVASGSIWYEPAAVSGTSQRQPTAAIPSAPRSTSPSTRASAQRPRAERGHRMPEGLDLSNGRAVYARDSGMDRETAHREWAKFSSHHQAKGSRFVDWDHAWRTWVLRWCDHPNGNGRRVPNREPSDLVGAVHDSRRAAIDGPPPAPGGTP